MSSVIESAFRAGCAAYDGKSQWATLDDLWSAYHDDLDLVSERAKAEHDSQLLGTGFLVDGMRVAPSRVGVIRKAYWPHVTSTELNRDLEAALRAKGASDAWIAYALPDLLLAASQHGASAWLAGHAAGVRGDDIPNPQTPADSAAERAMEDIP